MTKPPVLADLAALHVDGPTIVFVRPRIELSQMEVANVAATMRLMSRDHATVGMKVQYVLLPHEFEVMAVGECDLSQYGLQRIPGAEA